jgi:hypothetical protein
MIFDCKQNTITYLEGFVVSSAERLEGWKMGCCFIQPSSLPAFQNTSPGSSV